MVKLYDSIVEKNKELGGTIIKEGSLKWACDEIENSTMSVYRQVALIIRAIVVDHPFSDFNKSTSLLIATKMLYDKKIDCNENLLVRNIFRIAKNNLNDINKIERVLRRCCQKKKKE